MCGKDRQVLNKYLKYNQVYHSCLTSIPKNLHLTQRMSVKSGVAVVCIFSWKWQALALNNYLSSHIINRMQPFFRRKYTCYKDAIASYGYHHAMEISQLRGLSETCPFLRNWSDPGQALWAGASKSSCFANRLVNSTFVNLAHDWRWGIWIREILFRIMEFATFWY